MRYPFRLNGRPLYWGGGDCRTTQILPTSMYDPTIYLGSAPHYRRGRPRYSPELEATLVRELGLDGHGRLLDVGCGPGILTTRLAGLFNSVIGLDPDAAMLAEGRRAAEDAGLRNISWVRAARRGAA